MSIHSPSALIIDSGGGWFDSENPTVGLFQKPNHSITYIDNKVKIISDETDKSFLKNPLSVLEENISKGYIGLGYIGYNFVQSTNKGFKSRRKEGKIFPQIFFNFYKQSDYIEIPFNSAESFIKNVEYNHDIKSLNLNSNLTSSEYQAKVKRIKDYISAGDIYQVNLSQRYYMDRIYDPFSYYLKLYQTQPVPYSAFIDFDKFQLLSGSMELYLAKKGRKITTKPIKGTIKRGKNIEQDEQLRNELGQNIKERAENVMIVDLMRNDLGRICEYGSIKVNHLFNVKAYKTLFQMESEIEGNLKKGVGLAEIIYNTFPPGSVTGAPKRRALEIIDELEPHYRGPYCGAICLLLPNGDFKMSVAIRIKITLAQKSIFWVGSGIVWDSDPKNEYNETILKSEAIIRAIKKMN